MLSLKPLVPKLANNRFLGSLLLVLPAIAMSLQVIEVFDEKTLRKLMQALEYYGAGYIDKEGGWFLLNELWGPPAYAKLRLHNRAHIDDDDKLLRSLSKELLKKGILQFYFDF